MLHLIIILIFIIKIIVCKKVFPADYCQYICENTNSIHVWCLNPDCDIQPPCKGLKSFTPFESKELASFHNLLRSSIALGNTGHHGPVKNMRALTWDDQLQQIAECWLNYCSDKVGCLDIPNRYTVGQNLVFRKLTTDQHRLDQVIYDLRTYKKILSDWFAQYRNFTVNQKRYADRSYKEFTQMIWSDTALVGCARNYLINEAGEHVLMFLCAYTPAGNIDNQSVYTAGETCSDCPFNTKCYSNAEKYEHGLCLNQPVFRIQQDKVDDTIANQYSSRSTCLQFIDCVYYFIIIQLIPLFY